MAYPADLTFTSSLLTFFVTLICIRSSILPFGVFQRPLSWLSGNNLRKPHRRKAIRQPLSGVTAHFSDGVGYWQGILVDASAQGFCLDLKNVEGFPAAPGMFGLLLEKEGSCLPVRVELKWTRKSPGRMFIGLAVEDRHWSWRKFQETICRVSPAVASEA